MKDFHLAIRVLRRSPGFTVTALVTLALAIGANVAVFSMVNAMLLQRLPYPDADRLALVSRVVLRKGVSAAEDTAHTGAVWEAIRDHARSVDAAVVTSLSARVSLVSGKRAITVAPQRVGAGYFRVLGVAPAVGRSFTEEEDRVGGPAAAVLSDRLWRSVFDGDPSLVGQTVLIKGEPHVIAGVMPPSFRSNVDADLWTPVRASREGEGSGENYAIVARLRRDVSWAEASSEVAQAADGRLRQPEASSGLRGTHRLMPLQEGLAADAERPLVLLWAAVAAVLLVAAVNLAGLQLARAAARGREIATRMAVGGGRGAVVRQLVVESLVLATAGGLLGLGLAWLALDRLASLAGDLLAPWSRVALDPQVLGFALALTLATTIVVGLVPALQASRVDVRNALVEGGTRTVAAGSKGWPRRLLVVGEVALSFVLLIAAGLLIRTFAHLQGLSPGFDAANLVTASASLEDARYESHEAVERLFDRTVGRLREEPGVDAVAVSLGLPYERILNMGAQLVGADHGPQEEYRFSTATYVTPGYFETLRLPILEGREFNGFDRRGGHDVVVVNAAFARRYLPRAAIGQRLRVAGAVREIVGVSANVQQRGGFNGYGPLDVLPSVYLPFSQFPSDGLRLYHSWFSPAWIVRARPDAASVDGLIRQAFADADPQLPVAAIRGFDDLRSQSLARQRSLMVLVGGLGSAALALAALGIYGLIAGGVNERMRELGIRVALGSTTSQAIRAAALPGVRLALAGLVLGGVGAAGAAGAIRSQLWGVSSTDPMTFVFVAAVFASVAALASFLPALRVRKLDPAVLMRE
jgi:predicted permease